jgi:NADH dehydrogenase
LRHARSLLVAGSIHAQENLDDDHLPIIHLFSFRTDGAKDGRMESWKPRVVIIGGGFAGVAAARALHRANADVVVIDKHNHHLFQPLLYQIATAALHPGTIAAPIRSMLSEQDNCRVLMKEVDDVDLQAQTIMLGGEPYTYDYLVIATGMETNYFGNDSWKQYAPGLKTIDEAVDVRARFLLAFEQAEFETDPAAQRAALTFAIVGAGPTGVEMAGALAEIAQSVRKDFRSIDTHTARIILLDFAPRVLMAFPEDLANRAKKDLEELGVEVMLQTRVTDVDERGLSAETSEGPIRIDANNVIWAAGVKGTPLGEKLGVTLDRMGRVIVGEDLSVPGRPNVFVAGDLAHCVDPETGEPVPGVAQGAIQGGRFAGETIAAEIEALQWGVPVPPRKAFRYKDKGSMAIIGRNHAVAQIGKLHIGGYVAFLMWALIHILFLIGFRRKLVVFIEWVWLYLTGGRGARLITGDDRLPKVIAPPPDSRLLARRSHPGAAPDGLC